MHRIYFEKRCLTVCSPGDSVLTDPNTVEFHPSGREDVHRLVRMLREEGYPGSICIGAEDEEACYADVCSAFREVNAAGGLVSNRRGDFLLIRRNGLWDLPKGHQEAGEDIRVTALREVTEETGIEELVRGKLICITDHCYLRGGIWHLKHTWWYAMRYDGPVNLTPQEEEDIAKAAWVAKSSLPPFLKNTYPSIAEVFHEAKI